jgi:hypothetical protein
MDVNGATDIVTNANPLPRNSDTASSNEVKHFKFVPLHSCDQAADQPCPLDGHERHGRRAAFARAGDSTEKCEAA